MKIIGFAQLRNELRKENLENWFKCMNTVCDHIYIYDQDSDDDSQDLYRGEDKATVLESEINDFSNEIQCKSLLLERLLQDHEDVDWIFWMDGDTLLDQRMLKNDGELFSSTLTGVDSFAPNVDCIKLGHYNLWRSDVHYRTDNSYHDLNSGGVNALWRNTGKLQFPRVSGLHHPQHPGGITSFATAPFALIHRGFATDYQIMLKYDVYKSRGQSGNALERLLDEKDLNVELLPEGLLPEWFGVVDSEDPREKTPIRELYDAQNEGS